MLNYIIFLQKSEPDINMKLNTQTVTQEPLFSKSLNVFKNMACLSYHYNQKLVVDVCASTSAGSTSGVVSVEKTNFNSVFFYLK